MVAPALASACSGGARPHQTQAPAGGDCPVTGLQRRHGIQERAAQALPGVVVQAVDIVGVQQGGPQFVGRG